MKGMAADGHLDLGKFIRGVRSVLHGFRTTIEQLTVGQAGILREIENLRRRVGDLEKRMK